jgi:chemosensory pili system protein ChpA (sensor histidine kinase/response regulator)
MSGTGNGDDSALLIATFVEEIRPFIPGIRRGIGGIFALPRDTQAIGAARHHLDTLAASSLMLELPAARQLGELARLLLEGFAAAERGGVPDESRAPMLAIVDHLDAQIESLLHDDGQGRERLDQSYHLLEQVLQTVEAAEATPPPSLDISLDDLLLTLQPATPAAPPEQEPETAPLPALPEPTQTEIVLLAEDAVAPIAWGEKETILWNKGGWNERKSAYGNTEWIFLDKDGGTDSLVPPPEMREGATDDGVATATPAEAPTEATPPIAARATDLTIGPMSPGDTVAPTNAAAIAPPPATSDTPPSEDMPTAIASTPGTAPLGVDALEEAALLALSTDELEHYLALAGDEQHRFLRERLGEMADFATDLGIAIDPAIRAARDTGDLSALLGEPAHDTGALSPLPGEREMHTDALVAPPAPIPPQRPPLAAPQAGGSGTDRVLASETAPATATATEPQDSADGVTERTPGAENNTDSVLAPVDATPASADTPEARAEPPEEALSVAGEPDDAQAPPVPTADDEQRAQVDELVLTEYRAADHATALLGGDLVDVRDLALAAAGAERVRSARLASDRRSLGTGNLDADRSAPATATPGAELAEELGMPVVELAANDVEEPTAEESAEGDFLDMLLDEGPLGAGDGARPADADGFLPEDEADADPNFAALPDLDPAIEDAFARLSEAEVNNFLTLDGESALAFLRDHTATPQADAPIAAFAAAPAPPAGATDDTTEASPARGFDREIVEVFLQEMRELLAAWETGAAHLRHAPADAAELATLRRVAHTLKGAANMMGFARLGAAGWWVEDLLDRLDEGGRAVAPPILAFIDDTYAFIRRASGETDTSAAATLDAESTTLAARHGALVAAIGAGAPRAPLDTASDSATADGSIGEAAVDEDGAIDSELLDVFAQEAEEHLAAFGQTLVALDLHPESAEHIAEAKRTIHTLKGAAGALGYPVTAALCHSIEDLFGALDGRAVAPSREMLTLFFDSAEALETLVRRIAAGQGEDRALVAPLRGRYAVLLGQAGGTPQAEPAEAAPERPEEVRAALPARSVRVDIAHLDTLLNLVGELVINRTSQEQYLGRLGRTVAELGISVERLRRVGGQLESRYEVAELLRDESPRARLALVGPHEEEQDEFDVLEMDRYTELHRISRELIEIAADINTASAEFDGLYDGFEQTLARQGRIATDLQDRMMEVRLIPLSTIAARLYRAARGVATQRGREVELTITGETIEIDKVLLEEITDPLLHLVRNAADHGIEAPEERRRRGKPTRGTIRLSAAREGNEAVIRVGDDGAGIALDRVLDKALARGIIRRRDGLTPDQILDLIFLPGFSTSATISDISGRGVGLDVVRTNVARLKGTLGVESEPSVGTTFTIRLPIMLAVTRALLVRSGAQTFAIPLPTVEQVAFFRKELVSTIGEGELLDLGDTTYPIIHLNRALGIATNGEVAPGARALIVGNAERRVALVVDEMIGQQEIVVKRLGRHLQAVAGVAGATILGNGQVVLILNILDLIGARRVIREAPPLPQPGRPQDIPQGGPSEKLALVVDDSLSVRRVLTRTLERDGWQVLGAKDGVEALEILSWARPQVAILDIEMPRMDGYELLGAIRGGSEHHDLPVAMLTSRAGEKHRRKALDLGASAYLIKPFEESALLRTLRELGATTRRQAAG